MTSSKPLVSVIIATYNGLNTISDAVDSILRQTYKNIEIIVVNDCSTDATGAVLDRYLINDDIVVVENEVNIGLARSLNKGVSVSNGYYIARMDDDDLSYSDRIEEQVNYLMSNSDIDILGASVRFITQDCRSIREYRPPESDIEIKKALCYSNPIIHPTVMMTKNYFDLCGGYSEKLRRKEDLDFWGRAAKTARFHNLQKVLVGHRVKNSKTLTAVPVGVYVRLLNGIRLRCFFKAFLWSIAYVVIELMRHFGYMQKKFRMKKK